MRRRNVSRGFEAINERRTPWLKVLIVVGLFASLSALAVVLDWAVDARRPTHLSVPWMLLVFSSAFAITAAFTVWTAHSLGLPSFLLLAPISTRRRWWRFGIYGIGTGIFMVVSMWVFPEAVGKKKKDR